MRGGTCCRGAMRTTGFVRDCHVRLISERWRRSFRTEDRSMWLGLYDSLAALPRERLDGTKELREVEKELLADEQGHKRTKELL